MLDKRGYTLIEVMMVVAIMGLIMSVFYNYINFNFNVLNSRNDLNGSYFNARVAMNRIVQDVNSYQTLAVDGDYLVGNKYDEDKDLLFYINDIHSNNHNSIYYQKITNSVTKHGDLVRNGKVIAKNILLDIKTDGNNIQVNIEAFPDLNTDVSGIELSTILRIEHKRAGIEDFKDVE